MQTTETDQPSSPSTAEGPDTSPVAAWALVATRVLAAGAAVLTLGQGFLAGSHLVGVDSSLATHELVGTEVLSVLALLVAVCAAAAARFDPWRLPVAVVCFAAVVWQISLGFAGQLDLHVPVGLSIFGAYLLLAALPPPRRRSHEPGARSL